jgi:hypothetical protein
MLFYAILALVGAHVLRAQIAEEFPDAPIVSVRAALGRWGQAAGARIARARAAAAPSAALAGPSAAVAGPSKAAEVERLVALLDRGAITDEEYASAKRELFASP